MNIPAHRILSSLSVVATRGAGSVLQLGIGILLGRVLGIEGVGAYYLFLSTAVLAATFLAFGYPTFILRHIGELGDNAQKREARWGTVSACGHRVLYVAMPLLVIVAFQSKIIATALYNDSGLGPIVLAAAAAALGLALTRLNAEALKGEGRAELALSIEFVIPSAFVAAVALCSAFTGSPLSPLIACWAFASATLFVGVGGFVRAAVKHSGVIQLPKNRESLVFWAILLTNNAVASVPYFLLAQLASQEAIGLFGIAHRLVAVSATIMFSLNAMFGPRFARLRASNDWLELRREFHLSQVVAAVVYAPMLLIFLFFGSVVLTLMGPGFEAATSLLAIMAIGRMVNAAGGLGEAFLSMTGAQNIELANAGIVLTFLAIAGAAAGVVWGAVGIAVVFAAALALRSVVSWAIVEATLYRNRETQLSVVVP